jgi:inward rectifier potassium channel
MKQRKRRAPRRSQIRSIRPPSGRQRARPSFDLYHRLLTVGWSGFFVLLAVCYVAFNAVFAILYRLQDGSIASARPGFADAFFFSVQTMATIGYGEMRPATLYANILVSAEVLLGLTGFALATGVIFARFSRPTARVMFSAVAVVTRHDGKPTLMFRAANRRANRILDAQVNLMLARQEVTAEGDEMRRFHTLEVARSRTPLFGLSWTVMHVIDPASPLHGATPESLEAQQAEVIATILGIDETLSQTIHARHGYPGRDILFDRRFADILTRDSDGTTSIDYSRFHETLPRVGALPKA